MKIISYLCEYARITLTSIKTPRKFFEEMKSEGNNYSKPFAYMLLSESVLLTGLLLGISLRLASNELTTSMLIDIYTTIALWFMVYFVLMQLAIILVRGKGKLNQTFKVICYSFSPLNFGAIFGFAYPLEIYFGSSTSLLILILSIAGLFFCMVYMFYIVVVGISITSEISVSRAFAALMIQLFIFALIPTILAYAPAFFYQYGTSIPPDYSPTPSPTPAYENYTPTNPEKYRITAYAGSPPQIDGAVTEEDKWYEGETLKVEVKAGFHDPVTYNITTKHDFEYIYILMEWGIYPEGGNNIAISFDQDEGKPDFNLSNGRTDRYYQGYYKDNHFLISDTHYDSDDATYSDKEHQNGSLKGGYRNGKWTLEWKIPMNSGDKYDINIDKYPTEIGFSIIDTITTPGGIFPPDASKHDPRTWGTMTIVDKRLK